MSISPGYKQFVLDQLEPAAPITAKAMFGGIGLYAYEFFFAILAYDRLYFKVDDTNRPDFEQAGMEPFQPFSDGRTMAYYEVPVEVLEDQDELRGWAEKAIAVARRAKR